MLLHESRRPSRARRPVSSCSSTSRTDRSGIAIRLQRGSARRTGAAIRRFGPYSLQAAIPAVHAEARTAAETDWGQIVGLYDVLPKADPSPVVELNRAAAIAMRDGPAAGLVLIDAILGRGELDDYHLGSLGSRRSLPTAGPHCRCRGRLRARARTDEAGTGAEVSAEAPPRTEITEGAEERIHTEERRNGGRNFNPSP